MEWGTILPFVLFAFGIVLFGLFLYGFITFIRYLKRKQ